MTFQSDGGSTGAAHATPLLSRLARGNGFAGDTDRMADELMRRYAAEYPSSPLNLPGVHPLYPRGGGGKGSGVMTLGTLAASSRASQLKFGSHPDELSRSGDRLWDKLFRILPHGRVLAQQEWDRRHRAIVIILWLHVVGLAIFGVLRGFSAPHVALDAGAVTMFAAWATQPHGGRKLRATLASLGLLTASAVGVHLSGGLIEAHFHFFVVIALLMLCGFRLARQRSEPRSLATQRVRSCGCLRHRASHGPDRWSYRGHQPPRLGRGARQGPVAGSPQRLRGLGRPA